VLLNPEYSSINEIWGRHKLHLIQDELHKKGEKIVSLSGGVPMESSGKPEMCPDFVADAIVDGIRNKNPGSNVGDFQIELANWYNKKYGTEYEASNVFPAVGGSFGVDASVRLCAGPGDEVLVIDPDYVTYMPQAASTGARVISVPLNFDGEWSFDIEELKKRVNPMTKLLMMSNSNNPGGYLYTEKDNKAIAELAEKYDFMVLSDHVSEEFSFEPEKYKFHCIASLSGMENRTIITGSYSKMYGLSWLRTGWVVTRKDFLEHLYWYRGWVNDGFVRPAIDASLAILRGGKKTEDHVKKKNNRIKKQRDQMKKRLSEIEGVKPNTPRGLYWAFPWVGSFGMTSQKLAEHLLKKEKLSVRPGTWYGKNGEGHFRLLFALPWIDEAMDRMQNGLSKLPIKK
jgi:aminotransferase